MTAVGLTRRERKKEETKERIFQAAFGLFRKQGFEATTVEEICAAADVAKGTFFNYFPRKEAVFGYLSEKWVTQAEGQVAAVLAQDTPAWENVRDFFVGFAGFYEEDRALSKPMLAEWTRNMHDPEDAVCRRWEALGIDVVRRLQEKDELRADVPPERAHRLLEDVYHGTIMMWLESREPPFALKDELRRRLTLVIEGLAPRA